MCPVRTGLDWCGMDGADGDVCRLEDRVRITGILTYRTGRSELLPVQSPVGQDPRGPDVS